MHLRQRGKSAAPLGLASVEMRLGVEKVGIDQAREQHAQPQRKALASARYALQRGHPAIRCQNCCGRLRSQGLGQFLRAVGRGQAGPQILVPITQARMVSRNQIRQHMAVGQLGLVELLHRPQSASSGMRFLAPRHSVLDMRILGLPHVPLKAGAVFAQVVPATRQLGPRR